jgi:hypothetical protein
MPYNQLTNLDYFEIKSALKDYLRANSDFTDYDFEGSALTHIIDLLAYNTYYTAFNANMVANEMFLDSATLRDNVVSLAKQLGYVPRSAVSSASAVDITLSISGANIPQSVTFKKGLAFLTNVDETLYQYNILEDITAPVNSENKVVFSDVKIYEGSLITNKYQVADENITITLSNSGIDISSLRVRVFESSNSSTFEKYVLTDNILNVSPTSTVFYVNEIEDENYKIVFGDGVFGKKLTVGQVIEVSYLVCNGSATNNATNFTFNGVLVNAVNGSTAFSSTVSSITTLVKSFGGSDIESIDSIKVNAPAMYGTQNRAVTSSDYTSIIRRIYPAAADVITYGGEEADPPEYGKVKIAIKPKNISFLSSYSKNIIINELKKYSVGSVTPEIVDPSIIFIELNSRVFYSPNETTLTLDDIKTKVIQNISSYSLSSDTEKFGGKFRYSRFSSVIDNSDRSIKSNLTSIKMRKDFYPSLNNSTYYELCFSNQFEYDPETPSIVTTGFVVQKYPSYICYLEDRDGVIVLYRLDTQTNNKIVLNSNQGSVNYVKGEVKINDLTIIQGSFPDNKIELRVIPKFNDIIAKREIFLDVDIDKSTITAIQE